MRPVMVVAAINKAMNDGINVEATDTTRHPYILYALRDAQDLKSLDKTCKVIAIYDNAGYPKIISAPHDVIAKSDKILLRTPKLRERFLKR